MRHHERGSALLIAMLIMLAMAVLGATFLSVSITDRKIASNEADAGKAFAVAEAGIENARAALATTNVNTLLASGGHLFTGSSVGGGTYVVDVTNNVNTGTPPHNPAFPTAIVPLDPGGNSSDTDRFLVLNSTGTLKKASRRIETIVRMPTSFFNFGLWCNSASTFQGASDMDAYNSTLGPYSTSTNQTFDANAYCNGDITMQSNSHIWGDCTVSTSSCGDSSHWTTNTNNAPAQPLTAPACPGGGFTPAANVPAGAGVSYNAGTGALTVSGGNTLTLSVPPTSYYFSDLIVNSATLTFNNPSHLHVDVNIAGRFTHSGGGVVNTGTPPELTLWACGPATDNWDITGTSPAIYAIFAPTRNLTLSGNSILYGAAVTRQFTNSGHVHYDHALASAGFPSVVGRTWREIFP